MESLFLDRIALVPVRIMRHILFLLHSCPNMTDRWGYDIRPVHYSDALPDRRPFEG
jgi:hypothetical protein